VPHLPRAARRLVTGAALLWTVLSLPSSATLLLTIHSDPVLTTNSTKWRTVLIDPPAWARTTPATQWIGVDGPSPKAAFEHVFFLPGSPADDPFFGILVAGSADLHLNGEFLSPVSGQSSVLHGIVSGSWLYRLPSTHLLANGINRLLIDIRSTGRQRPALAFSSTISLAVTETAEASTWMLFASGLLLMALARISKRHP
jgi:hypothetical protein